MTSTGETAGSEARFVPLTAAVFPATTQQLSITLPTDMAEVIKAKVASGEYATELQHYLGHNEVPPAPERARLIWLATCGLSLVFSATGRCLEEPACRERPLAGGHLSKLYCRFWPGSA